MVCSSRSMSIRRKLRWSFACLSLFVSAVLLSGCEGVHLYDKERDDRAAAIRDEYGKIQITAVFGQERQNLDRLLAHELRVRDSLTEYVRNAELWQFIKTDQTLGGLLVPTFESNPKKYVDERLTALGIHSPEALEKAATALDAMKALSPEHGVLSETELLERARKSLIGIGWKEPWECGVAVGKPWTEAARVAGIPESEMGGFQQTYEGYARTCGDALEDSRKVDEIQLVFGPGEILDAYNSWQETLKALQALEGQRAQARTLLGELAASISPAESPIDLQARADELLALVSGVTSLGEVLGLEQELTKARIDSIEVLLMAFHDGSLGKLDAESKKALEADPDLHRAAIVVAGLPSLSGDIQALVGVLREPAGRAGLAIELRQQRIKLDYLNGRARLLEDRAELQRVLLVARLQEATLFRDTLVFLKDSGNLRNQTWIQVANSPRSTQKEMAYRSAIAFNQSIVLARSDAEEIRYKIVDSSHREAVLADEFAARSWDALMAAPIGQIAAYHASGIKPEVVADLIKGLAEIGILGAIGLD